MSPLQTAIQQLDQEIKDRLAEKNQQIEVLTTEASFWKDIAMRAVPFLEKWRGSECFDMEDAHEFRQLIDAIFTMSAVGAKTEEAS